MGATNITGLALRKGAVEWTTLRVRKESIESVQHQDSALELPEGQEAYAEPETVAAIKSACAKVKGQLSLALPTEHALMRVVDLPTTDPDELGGMVDLQVDKLSPFPVDQMAVSYEILDQTEENSRVLVVAARREWVVSLGGLFTAAGFLPHRIDVEVLGWWQLLKENGHISEEGRHLVLLLEESSVELVVVQEGVPVMVRSMGGHGGMDDSEFAQEVAEETGYTLTSLEADWGRASTARMSIWSWDPPAEDLVAKVQAESGLAPEHGSLKDLPPLSEGLARRAYLQGTQAMDLSPVEWHAEEQARLARKKVFIGSGIFLALWALVLGGFFVVLQVQRQRLINMKTRVEQAEGPAEEVRLIKKKVVELEEYADRKHSAIECLREISAALPRGVDLTSFTYKKAREVNLRGQTSPSSVNLIYEFFEALEGSELFERIENEKVTTTSGGNRMAQFIVKAILPGEETEEDGS